MEELVANALGYQPADDPRPVIGPRFEVPGARFSR